MNPKPQLTPDDLNRYWREYQLTTQDPYMDVRDAPTEDLFVIGVCMHIFGSCAKDAMRIYASEEVKQFLESLDKERVYQLFDTKLKSQAAPLAALTLCMVNAVVDIWNETAPDL